ncbi:MAG TPA: Clp protease N-terminal domain-containing protein [Methylomirabilota bacterium]|nr:Clp protease N-terminal domain-containing protein [Methylomirabilota bacterium]
MNSFKAWLKKLKEAASGHPGIDFTDLQGDFTPRAQTMVDLAHKHAVRLNHPFLGSEHLLLGLMELGQGVAVNVLKRFGVELESLRQEVERCVDRGGGNGPIESPPFSPGVKEVFSLAKKEAATLHHTYIGTEHLLLGLLSDREGVVARVLKRSNVELNHARQEILRELDPNFGVNDDDQSGEGKKEEV